MQSQRTTSKRKIEAVAEAQPPAKKQKISTQNKTKKTTPAKFKLILSPAEIAENASPVATCGTTMTRKLCDTADSKIFGKYFWVCEHNPGAFVMDSSFRSKPTQVIKCRAEATEDAPIKSLFKWIMTSESIGYSKMSNDEQRDFCNSLANLIITEIVRNTEEEEDSEKEEEGLSLEDQKSRQ